MSLVSLSRLRLSTRWPAINSWPENSSVSRGVLYFVLFFFSISLRLLAQLFDLSRLICDVCCAEHCVDMYMYPSFAMELTENKRQYRSWRRKGGLKGVSTILISYNLCFLFFNGDLQLGLAQQITC
jgi:hypothetical protein